MTEEITFFDLPSRQDNHCWSPNTWKARLYLNYKGVPYKTVWVEYPDIRSLLEGRVKPDAAGLYTLPAVLLPDGTYIMDSKDIALELDKRYPSNPVHMDSPLLSKLEEAVLKVKAAITAESIPEVPKLFLNEASQPYFLETRAQRFGVPLEQLEDEQGGPQCFVNARPHVQELTAVLKANPDGPYFEGRQFTFADIMWVAMLRFYERIGGDLLNDVLGGDRDIHLALLETCRPWLQRDNY